MHLAVAQHLAKPALTRLLARRRVEGRVAREERVDEGRGVVAQEARPDVRRARDGVRDRIEVPLVPQVAHDDRAHVRGAQPVREPVCALALPRHGLRGCREPAAVQASAKGAMRAEFLFLYGGDDVFPLDFRRVAQRLQDIWSGGVYPQRCAEGGELGAQLLRRLRGGAIACDEVSILL